MFHHSKSCQCQFIVSLTSSMSPIFIFMLWMWCGWYFCKNVLKNKPVNMWTIKTNIMKQIISYYTGCPKKCPLTRWVKLGFFFVSTIFLHGYYKEGPILSKSDMLNGHWNFFQKWFQTINHNSWRYRGELINSFVFCQPITVVYCGQLTNESAQFL